ncbi:unnamed protein product, partial [Pylaiella littoralis]
LDLLGEGGGGNHVGISGVVLGRKGDERGSGGTGSVEEPRGGCVRAREPNRVEQVLSVKFRSEGCTGMSTISFS